MTRPLKRYALLVLVVFLASLVYAGSASGWRRPQGVPLNALHVCRDGVRFEAGGPLNPVNTPIGNPPQLDAPGGRLVVAAERVPFRSFTENLYEPELGTSIFAEQLLTPESGTMRPLITLPEGDSVLQEGEGLQELGLDERHQLYKLTPEAYRQVLVSRAVEGGQPQGVLPLYTNRSVTNIATYTLPWLRALAPGTDHVNLVLGTDGANLGHGSSARSYEYIGAVEDCSLFRGAPSNARMVGKGSLRGTSRSASCTETRPPSSHRSSSGNPCSHT